MRCDLATVFRTRAATLPMMRDGNHYAVLSAQTLPVPPVELATDQLVIARFKHTYNDCYRADSLWFQAHKHTYGYLGLLILAVLFHPQSTPVHVTLHHPASDIKHLELDYADLTDAHPGYHTRPHALGYYPSEPWRSRDRWSHVANNDLPSFYLTLRGVATGYRSGMADP